MPQNNRVLVFDSFKKHNYFLTKAGIVERDDERCGCLSAKLLANTD
jgi:hypothetical protein